MSDTTELLRQFLISLLESSGGAGVQASYDIGLINKAKLQEPRYQTLVTTDRDKPVPDAATPAQRKVYYTVLVKVLLSPSLGGILLRGPSPLIGGAPAALEDATAAFSKRAEGPAHLGSPSFNEAKLAAELAVYLRDHLLPVLRTRAGRGEAVRIGEDYAAAAAALAPAPVSIVSPPELVSAPAALPAPLDQAVWAVLVQEVLIKALQRFADERPREWTDYWIGRQRLVSADSLKTVPPVHARLPADLGPVPSADAANALAQLYRAGFACLALYWRHENASRYRDTQSHKF